MANIKDFATALILTAPSPATSGTSLVLASGMGARMPAVPFNAVAHPDGQLPTLDNAERVLVTARSTDTLTITRAQGGTTAKSIAAGWRFSNTIVTDDILNASTVTDELMTGTVNGSNTVFTTGSNFSGIQVYKNGVAMHRTDDFTITGANQVTFVTAPATGTKLTASYIIGSQTMINGSNSTILDETPAGTVNGSNTTFTTARAYIAGSLQVFVNGVKQKRTTHFTETTPASGIFTMGDAPLTGDDIMVNYHYVQSVYGNADTVDGVHANTVGGTDGQLIPDYSGWVLMPGTLTYASATTINTPADYTAFLGKGDKIRLKQGGAYKYFYIIAITSTVITVNAGTDYTVANAAITDLYYSKMATPQGFPTWFNFMLTGGTFTMTYGSLSVYYAKYKLDGTCCTVMFNVVGTTSGTPANALALNGLPVPREGTVPYDFIGAGITLDTAISTGHCVWNGASQTNFLVNKNDDTNFGIGSTRQARQTLTYVI